MKQPPPLRSVRPTAPTERIVREARPRSDTIPDAPRPHRLYLNRSWFIEVNDEGYVHGICFEGAFGCVLPLHEHPGQGQSLDRLALKIPRMMADTVRENEFIRHIVETEAHFVREANRELRGADGSRRAPAAGLVPIERLQFDLLRGIRELRGSADDARTRQDGNVILICFPKDRPPRIVSCRLDNATGELHVFPPKARRDLGFINRDVWERMRDPNPSSGVAQNQYAPDFHEPFFIESRGPDAGQPRSNSGPLKASIVGESETSVWYSALPSIVYCWAQTTLQATVCAGESQRKWRLAEHYDLHLQVARGIDTLHARGLLHGDVRPANIMAMGEPADPLCFAVGDYGSFSVDPSRAGDAPVITGNTMTGASVSRQRMSLFYAPERRHGIERELADVAVVLSDFEDFKTPYLLCLGWRDRIIETGGAGVSERLREELVKAWERMLEQHRGQQAEVVHSLDLPRPKDRLRIRDFIFEVIRCESRPGILMFLCERRFARVLHERIAAYAGPLDTIPDGTVISLPSYSEIHQWSAATDLYGMGALSVYTLFMRAAQANHRKKGGIQELDDSQNSRFETQLAELMRRLESVSLLNEMWDDLDAFWRIAERWNEHTKNPETEKMPVFTDTVREFATKTTNSLLRIPHMRNVLQCFSEHMVAPRDGVVRPPGDDAGIVEGSTVVTRYNVAHFLFFMHYVLACVHRRAHLVDSGQAAGGRARNIICADRCEPTSRESERASQTALQRLTILQSRLNSPIFRGFLVDADELDFDYKPQSDFQLMRQLAAYEECVKEIGLSTAMFRCGKIWKRYLGLEQYLQRLSATLAKAELDATMSSPPAGSLPPAE